MQFQEYIPLREQRNDSQNVLKKEITEIILTNYLIFQYFLLKQTDK